MDVERKGFMADKKKMTVAEMLAAARKADSKGAQADTPPAAPAAESPAEPAASAPASETPAPAAPATPAAPAAASSPPKDPKKMSVAEMLAAARAEKAAKAAAAAETPAAAAPAAATPAATPKPAAAKPAAAVKETPAPVSGEKDTASILAAVRKSAKPGPVSKTEAPAVAEKTKPAPKKLEVPAMPEKPAYARPRPAAAAAQAQTSRRGFLSVLFGSSLAIGFTSLAVTHLLWVLGLARYMFPNVLIEPPTRFKVGFIDDFSPGQVSEKYKAQFGTWIVRYEFEGQPMVFALKTVCTHLGCTPNWLEGEQKFKCPCHGSGFYKDGINFEGPAPRPLERYAISIADDGQLEVDKSATFHEETGQWADPASFVPV